MSDPFLTSPIQSCVVGKYTKFLGLKKKKNSSLVVTQLKFLGSQLVKTMFIKNQEVSF